MVLSGAQVGQWVLFGVLILFALTAPYISQLLFLILINVKVRNRKIRLLERFRYHLLVPFTHLLVAAFLYLAIFIPFPTFWNQAQSETGGGRVLYLIITRLLLCYVIFGSVFALFRFSKFLIELTEALLNFYGIPKFSQNVILEAVTFVCAILVLIFAIFMITVLFDGSSGDASYQVVSLLTGINWITMSIILGVTPIFRDIFAGLTMFTDNVLHRNVMIRLIDVSQVCYVEEFRLRSTLVRNLDHSLTQIPNSKFLRYPMINYSYPQEEDSVYSCEIMVPLEEVSNADKVRECVHMMQLNLKELISKPAMNAVIEIAVEMGAEKQPTKQADDNNSSSEATKQANQLGHIQQASVTYDGTFSLVISLDISDKGLVCNKLIQSELLLYITELLHRHQLKVRGRSHISYRSKLTKFPVRACTD